MPVVRSSSDEEVTRTVLGGRPRDGRWMFSAIIVVDVGQYPKDPGGTARTS